MADQLRARRPVDLAIVGGGLAGLTAAVVAARAWRSVILYERASSPGGRAVTREIDGFRFNVGPHAIYRAGAGIRVLRDLGLEPAGGVVTVDQAFGLRDGRLHALPAGLKTLLTTSLLGVRGKLELARKLAGLYTVDPSSLEGMTVEEWLTDRFISPDVRDLVGALVRVGTYADAPSTQSAGAALRRFQAARVARFLVGVAPNVLPGSTRVLTINGRPAIAARDLAGHLYVLSLDIADDRVRGVYLVVNPDKPRAVEQRAGT